MFEQGGTRWLQQRLKQDGHELSDEDAAQLWRLVIRFQKMLRRAKHEAWLRSRVLQPSLFDL
ncbi:MAG TPA: hypothetical protein VG753_02070 [Candidatus Paceibacterota bacterium]|nr:hypothetical protein [Candidatus Paceibacterota bacterium]